MGPTAVDDQEKDQYREASGPRSRTPRGRWTTVDDVSKPTCVRPRVRGTTPAAAALRLACAPQKPPPTTRSNSTLLSRTTATARPRATRFFVPAALAGHARRIKAAAKELKGRLKEVEEARAAARGPRPLPLVWMARSTLAIGG